MKNFIFNRKLLNLFSTSDWNNMKPIPIYARQTVILEEFIDRTFNVYNGRTFELLRVSPEMVGLRFGDFVFTKQMTTLIHKEKINKKK